MRIVAEKINYSYNPKTPFAAHALKDATLTIEEGDFFGIIGHTGSGKSTFIQHLNAIIPLSEGSLKIGDYDLSDKKCNLKELRSKVGMVFQYPEYQLFAETVYEDVAFGLKNFSSDGKVDPEKVRSAIETVGLNFEEVKDKSPFDLSGGQKRRVAIAGVIVTSPEILVLDEPAAGLDPQGKEDIMRLLHKLHSERCKTVVIVSHNMDEIAENCNRVAVFSEGKVVAVESPKELFKKTKWLQDLGLDVPCTAKVTDMLSKDGVDIESDFTSADFTNAVVEYYKKIKTGI